MMPLLRWLVLLCLLHGSPGASTATQRELGCRYNLTQGNFVEWGAVQGAGWLQGDWTSVAFTTPTASLSLGFNQTGRDLPALAISIQQPNGIVLLKSAPIQRHGLTVLNVSLGGIEEGEYPVQVVPDSTSVGRGWCGYMPRVLRKQTAPALVNSPPVLALRVGQPVAMFDNYFVSSRAGTLRVLNPPVQRRISNESWVRSMPPYMWQAPSSGIELRADGRLSFNMAINFAAGPGTSSNSPTVDPTSLHYKCRLDLRVKDAPWHCSNNSKSTPHDNQVTPMAGDSSVWSPGEFPDWPLKDTDVRYYSPEDGPVNLAAMSLHYTGYGTSPTIYPRLSLLQMSTYPIWQQEQGGQKQTLVLPVDGVNGRPLTRSVTLSARSPHPSTNTLTNPKICRDINNCRCDGDNITDVHCANDNFGGQWLLPPDGATRNMTFVYSQGRIISAFAPQAAGYDNLAEVRRVLVTWSTSDGLSWKQRWWGGEDPTAPAAPTRAVPEQYGADIWCYEAGLSPRTACRHNIGEYHGSPLLAWVMPYDAKRQQFWEDLAFSTDGVTFSTVKQEGRAPARPAIPNGIVGEWNGGLLMGISQGVSDARTGRTHALLKYANSGFHFMGEFRGMTNVSVAAVQAKGESSFFGPLLPSTFPWFAKNGGWDGLARIVPRLAIEVGHVSWRTEGLVALQAAVAGAVVTTKPLRAQAGSCSNLSVSINYRGGDATVELLKPSGSPINGFSGAAAAFVPTGTDDVALRLQFGSGVVLPSKIRTTIGIQVRVVMHQAGAQLFGISLRCAT